MKIAEILEGTTLLGSEPKRNPLYLGPTEPVAKTGPILGTKPKKQRKLMNKFFGGS
jgi:hypothetical protein